MWVHTGIFGPKPFLQLELSEGPGGRNETKLLRIHHIEQDKLIQET